MAHREARNDIRAYLRRAPEMLRLGHWLPSRVRSQLTRRLIDLFLGELKKRRETGPYSRRTQLTIQ